MSLEFPSFLLSIVGLCITLVIVSEQRILRRKLKEKDIQDMKNTINGMITDIQTTNQGLNAYLTHLSKDTNTKPFWIEMAYQQYQKLENEINTVRSRLHVYHDEYSKNVKLSIHGIGAFPLIPISIFQNSYDVLIERTKEIERRCRPFTNIQYGFVEINTEKKN